MFLKRVRTVHLIGIAGIGMSGIAEILLNLGFQVSGSDLRDSDLVHALRRMGGRVFIGHRPEQVEGADVVVFSSAVPSDNVEILSAKERRIPLIPRAEMLAELMRMKIGVAVAGSHGKTTTSSMIATCLSQGGLDPTVVIGGKVNQIGSNAKLGRGEVMVVEADESDGSFLQLTPTVAVVTNIDPEHLDHYRTLERLQEAFLSFANQVPFYGSVVVSVDDPRLHTLLPDISRPLLTYGSSDNADYYYRHMEFSGLRTSFDVVGRGEHLGRFTLSMPGRHNALNCLAAVAVALEFEVPPRVIQESLNSFGGIQRRFTVRGERKGVMVVDDYAHHPAEIRATLAGAKAGFQRPVVAVFQPHRYTRARDLYSEFMSAFDSADRLIVMDIYPAGEEAIPGVSGLSLCRGLEERDPCAVFYGGDRSRAVAHLTEVLEEGDMVITLGAGDVWKVGRDLLNWLGKEES